jgi:hypothetical protein
MAADQRQRLAKFGRARNGHGRKDFFFKKKDTQNSLYLILFLSRIIKVATIDIQLEKSLHTKITIYDLYEQCIGVRAKDFNSMKIRGGRSISKSLRVKNFDPPKI